MKRTYISPRIECLHFSFENILAASPAGNSVEIKPDHADGDFEELSQKSEISFGSDEW